MDYNSVLQTLVVASSTVRGDQQQAAEEQLKKWESEKGFYYTLQSIYINQELSLQIRWLAVICLKNGVEKYWRSTRINSITKEEKVEIRKRLFDTLDESNNQLCIQNAHLTSRICRLDFPVEWPTLFEDLVTIMESCDTSSSQSIVRLNNLMIILNQILKILASVRIGKARVMMQAKAPIVLPHLMKFYTFFFNQWYGNNYDLSLMEVGYITLKVIRRMVVDGYAHPNRDKYVQEFMEVSLQHFQKMLVAHKQNELALLERYIKCYVKLFHNLVSANTCAFVLMSSSKHILLTLLSLLSQEAEPIYALDNETDFWEKIATKSFIIMKIITNYTFNEKTSLIKQRDDKTEIIQSIEYMKTNFFNTELVESLLELITGYYLRLRPIDLESWNEDPEEWFNEESNVNYEFQVRKAAENYFQDLSIFFNQYISKYIMDKVNNLNNPSLSVIEKDATLAIFQLSSHSIKEECNFNQLLTDYFIPQGLSGNDLIKRRICLIINEWVDEKTNSQVRIQIYEFLVEIFSASTIVKLTSVQTLKNLIDDWEFRKRDLQPFTTTIIRNFLELINSLSTIECKNFVLNAFSIVIERNTPLLEESILVEIARVVPVLWGNFNNSNETIIKNSLLRILKDLVIALNKGSSLIHDMVLPLIPICCNPNSEYYTLLCEDGLELWSALMKTTSQIVLADDAMFDMLINALLVFTEILPLVLTIIRSYTLIDVQILETPKGMKILEILAGYLKTMRDDAVSLTSSIVEVGIMQKSEKSAFYSNLFNSKLIHEIAEYLIGDTDSAYCEVKLSLPLLRLFLDNSQAFLANIPGIKLYALMNNLIKFGRNSYDPKIRKLYVLGLYSLLKQEYLQNGQTLSNIEYELSQMDSIRAVSSVLLSFVKPVVDLGITFIEEIREDASGDMKAYHKSSSYDDDELKAIEPQSDVEEDNEYYLETLVPPNAERERYTALLKQDPVRNIPIRDFIRNIMGAIFPIIGNLLDSNDLEELQRL